MRRKVYEFVGRSASERRAQMVGCWAQLAISQVEDARDDRAPVVEVFVKDSKNRAMRSVGDFAS